MASIWEYANPLKFMRTTEAALPFIAVAAAVCLLTGLGWGFFFTPDDFRQGSTVKIFYIHVPSAMMAINIWVMMLITSLVWIVRRHHVSALAARAAAPVGAIMTLIALFTGAVWGQPMWGTWWVWDARLTSELILFFIYLSIIFLYHAYDDYRKGAKAANILAIVGFINIPIIHFSVEWWNTLHQPASINILSKSSIHSSMLFPLLIMTAAFALFSLLIFLMKYNTEMIKIKNKGLDRL